jgi:hypothetical protein
MISNRLYGEMTHDRCENQSCLAQCESGANAGSHAGAERQPGKSIDIGTPAQKAAGIETIGVAPQPAVAVQHLWRDNHHRAAFNSDPGKFIRPFATLLIAAMGG